MKLTQPRQVNGRYATKRWPLSVKIGIIVIIAWMGYGAYLDKEKNFTEKAPTSPTIAFNVAKAMRVPDRLDKAIKTLTDKALDDLSIGCETKGLKDPDGAIIFDSNNEASIGRFQFQRKTVIYYVKLFEGKDISVKESIAIAIDPVQSRELAKKILFFDEGKGAGNWYNCDRKMKIAEQVETIKELQKIN